jgi:hypothetical protein
MKPRETLTETTVLPAAPSPSLTIVLAEVSKPSGPRPALVVQLCVHRALYSAARYQLGPGECTSRQQLPVLGPTRSSDGLGAWPLCQC